MQILKSHSQSVTVHTVLQTTCLVLLFSFVPETTANAPVLGFAFPASSLLLCGVLSIPSLALKLLLLGFLALGIKQEYKLFFTRFSITCMITDRISWTLLSPIIIIYQYKSYYIIAHIKPNVGEINCHAIYNLIPLHLSMFMLSLRPGD